MQLTIFQFFTFQFKPIGFNTNFVMSILQQTQMVKNTSQLQKKRLRIAQRIEVFQNFQMTPKMVLDIVIVDSYNLKSIIILPDIEF